MTQIKQPSRIARVRGSYRILRGLHWSRWTCLRLALTHLWSDPI